MTNGRTWLFALILNSCVYIPLCRAETASIGPRMSSDSVIMGQLQQKGVVFTHNNSVVLLESGQEKFDDLFNAIRQSQSSVHLEYFNFRYDSIAHLLFELLAQKAAEGVEVRALFDGFGNDSNNSPLKKKHIRQIRNKGIEIYEYNPVRFPWLDDVWCRDHRKIVIVDGQIAYTGGMNVADYYIKGTSEVGSWRDMHCRIEGGAVSQLQMIFLKIWNRTTRQNVWGQKYFRAYQRVEITGLKPDTTVTAGHKTVGIINREPHISNEIIRTFYIDAINDAQRSIQIVNPYPTMNRALKRTLRKAVDRGVNVEIMVSTHSDIPLTPDCVFYNMHKLMKHGVKVWMYTPGFHHSKVIMVDSAVCTVGSANLNARSLNWDMEVNAVIIDSCTTNQLSGIFERDKKDCFILNKQTWDNFRSPWQKFRGWLAHLLTPFL